MKLLAVFLAVVTLFLSVSPCCGNDNQAITNGADDHCEHTDDEREPCGEEGLCSPFYACGSCSGFTLSQSAMAIPLGEPLRNVVPAMYREFTPKDVFFLSFKPPRII